MNFNKFIFIILISFFSSHNFYSQKLKPLKIGTKAPDFNLPGIDGKTYSLKDFSQSEILVIIFTSNHCPTAQAYEDKLIKMAIDFSNISISFVAISPNNPDAIPLEDQGYSELGDSFEEMKIRAENKAFNFPYLYDGDNQEVSKKYGLQTTPHVFIFDKERNLRYQGRFDNIENPYRESTQKDTRAAILAIFTNIEVSEKITKPFGCPVKWSSDIVWKNKIDENWNKKEVKLEKINIEKLEKLRRNYRDNILFLYIWSNNDSSKNEDLENIINIHRIYNRRFFEVNSIALNNDYENILELLKKKNAAVDNYLFNNDISESVISIIDTSWNGKTPLTLMIAPEGEIINKWEGKLNLLEVRKTIIEEIGRYYAND
ncbi:thioredoxin family protein [Bacteroidota bacterium]